MNAYPALSPELIRSILDSAPDAMVVIDPTGTIILASQQVTDLFGYDRADLVGRGIEILLPRRFHARHVMHRQQYAASGRRRPMGTGLDLFAARKDGSEFPVEICLSPISDGVNALVVAAIRDVSDRRRVQMELREARAAAECANLAKGRFLATASHDLRQPLQTLALLMGGLRRMVKDDDQREALVQAEQAIGAMGRLLNGLLDISKLEAGVVKPEITDFAVATLFEELRAEFAGVAASKGLEFSMGSCDSAVHSDPSLLGQVLRNLVSNALKYTRAGWVQLHCLLQQGFVRIEVSDTGIGIPADQLAHIYEEFFQVGCSPNSVRDGYGLGLSIVQRIVRLLDLKLEVTSQIGKGSTFALLVPASHVSLLRDEAHSAERGDPESVSAGRPHVLLVEDDAAVRGATGMLLKVAGYRVTAAACLSQAIAEAREHRNFDLLITDYHLGGTETGMDVITAVRLEIGPDLKALLVTGDTSSAVKDLEHDANTRIASKPINADDFLRLLEVLRSCAQTPCVSQPFYRPPHSFSARMF
ncbi:MAG: ATP-binding protein [Steroidobacteraceae bacterium]